MKSSLLLLAFFFIQTSSNDFNNEEVNSCKTAEKIQYFNQVEKDILFFINLVRINPKKFNETILKPYIVKYPEHSKKYSLSLINDLKKGKKLNPLKPTKDLFNFAKKHALTTGRKGKVGHRSARGKSFQKRTKELIKKYSLVGENIHYGSNNALEIVIDLLIDDGIKGVGHRVNILTQEYIYCSVSIQQHKKYKYNCVIDFAGKKI
tara:strand:+ start:303 stop:920 length:618 start_codon:yes stop_codon:yes gene_type:complete